jgi:hypothetical protein
MLHAPILGRREEEVRRDENTFIGIEEKGRRSEGSEGEMVIGGKRNEELGRFTLNNIATRTAFMQRGVAN